MAGEPHPTSAETTEQETSGGDPVGTGFVTPPSRAEQAMPRAGREQPLWPWLLIVAAVVIAAVIFYFAS